MVEIFKTNIDCADTAETIRLLLMQKFPTTRINFDLFDCDRILRVEADSVPITDITGLVVENGYECMLLDG